MNMNEPIVIFKEKIEEKYVNESIKFALNMFNTLSLFKGIETINRFFNKYKDQTIDIGLITWKKNNLFFNKGELYKKPTDLNYPILLDGISKITEIHSVYIFNNDSDKGFYVVIGRIPEIDKLNDILSKRVTMTDQVMDDCLTEYNFYTDEAEHLSSMFYVKNFMLK